MTGPQKHSKASCVVLHTVFPPTLSLNGAFWVFT